MPGPGSAPRADGTTPPDRDPVSEVIRWAAVSCVIVPVVLLWCDSSPAGAGGVALGLAAVTAVCRLLLRRSARAVGRPPAMNRPPRHVRHHRPRAGARRAAGRPHRGGRHNGRDTPVG